MNDNVYIVCHFDFVIQLHVYSTKMNVIEIKSYDD